MGSVVGKGYLQMLPELGFRAIVIYMEIGG